MIEVRLSLEDWNRVLAILAQSPWQAVNQLIMSIAEQCRQHSSSQPRPNGAAEEAPPTQRQ
jgi:hypothetical protein